MALGAFLFALVKYVFIRSEELSPKFFIFEFVSYGLFLLLIYLYDRSIRDNKNEQLSSKKQFIEFKKQSDNKIEELEREVEQLKANNETGSDGDEVSLVKDYFATILKSLSDIKDIGKHILLGLSKQYDISIGICYFYNDTANNYEAVGTYGLGDEVVIKDFIPDEGLNGQAIRDQKTMVLNEIDDEYFDIESCSGSSKPKYIYLLPIVKDKESIGLIEIASFAKLSLDFQWDNLNEKLVNTISI
ncbi:GAF domain-containing protein [Labilibacter marinus]|uniref:GAF domain-containing protein n=1 Tax=Labilibacter marinus TaxID=1477105 RepID=UPI00117BAEDF|nr:GAF domain-containing protein [Labilibacter marinus]